MPGSAHTSTQDNGDALALRRGNGMRPSALDTVVLHVALQCLLGTLMTILIQCIILVKRAFMAIIFNFLNR